MSSPYETSRSRRRGVWSHWVPLAVTITIATIGVAAWAWSQRKNEEEENDAAHIDYDYETVDYGDNPAYGTGRDLRQSAARPALPNVDGTYGGAGEVHPETSGSAAGWGSHVSGALRRTPSPQQFLSNAGKTVAAGVAGVGAAVGSALAAIREEDKTAYADHETWSEEAEARKEKPSPRPSPRPTPSPRPSPSPIMASPKMSPPKPVPPKFASPKVSSPAPRSAAQNRKTIVLVVSADINVDDFEEIESQEIASILSHIPRNIDFAKIKLFVLIYAPGIKDAGIETIASNLPPASLSSSFSNISHNQAQIANEETKSPPLSASNPANSAFNAAFSQALALVEKETMVMPFTTAGGYVHILRHLEPDVLYLQASLAGEDGNLVTQIQSWLRHDVILVVGADGGHGGLADSESEAEHNDSVQRVEKSEPWWQKEERVGRGRGVIVVDSLRVGDDWSRRVLGNE